MKKNRTQIKVKGLNQERALNSIVKKVNIYNYKREEHDICQFEVEYRERRKIKKLIDDHGLEILSIKHRGILSFFKSILTSYGIIIALVLSTLFYTLQYSLVWDITVFGTDKIEAKIIENYTKNQLKSRFKHKIDTKLIENDIKSNFKEVSSVSVAIVGQSLIINLNEANIPEEMGDNYQPIVSKFDGLITDITLIEGTLQVDVGDIVKEGDILVQPYVIDSQGEQRQVVPKAEIYADVWLSETVNHYDYAIQTIRTGNSVTKSEVYLGSLLIYSNKKPFSFVEYEQEEYIQPLTKNLILPFKVKKITYYETTTVEIQQDFVEVKENVIENAREKALIFLQENEIIKEENYSIRESGNYHSVNYVITVNRNIGG